jgi:hypothetical protein
VRSSATIWSMVTTWCVLEKCLSRQKLRDDIDP